MYLSRTVSETKSNFRWKMQIFLLVFNAPLRVLPFKSCKGVWTQQTKMIASWRNKSLMINWTVWTWYLTDRYQYRAVSMLTLTHDKNRQQPNIKSTVNLFNVITFQLDKIHALMEASVPLLLRRQPILIKSDLQYKTQLTSYRVIQKIKWWYLNFET